MIMQPSRVGVAAQKHKDGFNCCQAVLCTYNDLLGVNEETTFRCAEGCGLGIAGMFLTCGSVCGMEMPAGLKNSDCNLKKQAANFPPLRSAKKWRQNSNRRILLSPARNCAVQPV